MAYDNNNSGTIGKNKKKTEPNHADITGKGTIDGREYWINGWQKKGQDGSTFYSLSFRPRDEQQSRQQQRSEPQPPPEEDIPF